MMSKLVYCAALTFALLLAASAGGAYAQQKYPTKPIRMIVPYKGTVAALTDVMGGRAEVMFVSPGVALPFVKDGRVRVLGVTGQHRLPALPDVPTVREAGLAGYEFTG